MEKDQEVATATPISSKRPLEDDDVSPESQQKTKGVKEMTTMEENIAKIMDELKKLNKLDTIEAQMSTIDKIKEEVTQIRQENAEFRDSLKSLSERVKKLEEHVEAVDSESVNELKGKIISLESKNNVLEQAQLNTSITIHNLPKDIGLKKENLLNFLGNLFEKLNVGIHELDYEAYAYNLKGNTANANIKFASTRTKNFVMQKYRELKKTKGDPQLVLEKFFNLPQDHELNGKMIRFNNQLTPFNHKLLQYARKFVPSLFLFAIDSDDGAIKIKVGTEKLKKVTSIEEVDEIVGELKLSMSDKGKNAKKGKNNVATSNRITRLNSNASNVSK